VAPDTPPVRCSNLQGLAPTDPHRHQSMLLAEWLLLAAQMWSWSSSAQSNSKVSATLDLQWCQCLVCSLPCTVPTTRPSRSMSETSRCSTECHGSFENLTNNRKEVCKSKGSATVADQLDRCCLVCKLACMKPTTDSFHSRSEMGRCNTAWIDNSHPGLNMSHHHALRSLQSL